MVSLGSIFFVFVCIVVSVNVLGNSLFIIHNSLFFYVSSCKANTHACTRYDLFFFVACVCGKEVYVTPSTMAIQQIRRRVLFYKANGKIIHEIIAKGMEI